MSRHLYKKYVELIKQWPIDETKIGRDLGEHLRKYITEIFPNGELTEVKNLKEPEQLYFSLNRICQNKHSNNFARSLKSTALDQTPEKAGTMISNEALEILKK